MLVIGAAVIAAASLKIYYIRSDSGGSLIWNSDEAYLFLGGSQRGYKLSYLEYPWEVLKEYLYVPPFPSDQYVAVNVIHVTPSAIEHNIVYFGHDTGNLPNYLTPLDNQIYAMCPGAVLCKWTGGRFELATEQEKAKPEDTKHLIAGDIENSMNGWSKRALGPTLGDRFSFDIGKGATILVNQMGHKKISIELLRSGQKPETLWNLDGDIKTVSKNEYQQTFEKPLKTSRTP